MSSFVVLVGSVDGEVRTAQVGTPPKPVANFRMDCKPGWYSVAAWSDLAAKVPPAGTNLVVTGRLSGRSYDKQVGTETVKINVVEIVASTIETIGAPATITVAPADDLFGD